MREVVTSSLGVIIGQLTFCQALKIDFQMFLFFFDLPPAVCAEQLRLLGYQPELNGANRRERHQDLVPVSFCSDC